MTYNRLLISIHEDVRIVPAGNALGRNVLDPPDVLLVGVILESENPITDKLISLIIIPLPDS